MDEIMSGKATPVQMSAYPTAMALKGETIDAVSYTHLDVYKRQLRSKR